MDQSPFENQLQSWKPRPPSPRLAHRLFGPAQAAPRRVAAWNWLSPVAACALTMLVALHTASRVPGRLAQGSNATLFASMMLNAAVTSNIASYTVSEVDENLEWNVWKHATHRLAASAALETSVRREHEFFSLIPTNR
jgi:hypothetical protein